MASSPLIFFVFLSGISVLSTDVVGFTASPLSSSSINSSSRDVTTTVLRYVAETNFHGEQYQYSRPNDVKVVDVEVESKSKFVYIPLQEMEDAMNKAQENHENDCETMKNIINEQREELQRLKEQNEKAGLSDRMQYDHLTENANANWGENHEEKMKRTTDRVKYLTNENNRLQAELDGERQRFELETGRLQQKLEEARDETEEAHQMLSVERSYFEKAVNLLEVGLEREANNVRALEDQLMQYNELGYHDDHRPPFHDDLPPFETWETSGAYEQQQEAHHNEFHHHSHHTGEVFEDFEPQVRPQEGVSHCHQDYNAQQSQHEVFQGQEPQSFHGQHGSQQDIQRTQQNSYARSNTSTSTRRSQTATTTELGASSIRDNLGINDIRDPIVYR